MHAMAQEHGHTVLMLPPYRPELNAIETAWAVGKNYVSRNNSAQQSFAGLLYVIEKGMDEVTLPVWSALDTKICTEEARQLSVLEGLQARQEAFALEHPDLRFQINGSESESDGIKICHLAPWLK